MMWFHFGKSQWRTDPGVQEGKQEDGLGNDCGGPHEKGWGPGLERSQVRSCFNSVFPPFTSC